jgi:hypothetical protein
MRIDRNVRARLGAQIRRDTRLTHTAKLVGLAILFAGFDCGTGRCQMYRQRIAREADVSLRSVDRAISQLRVLRYLAVIPTYADKFKFSVNGRRYKPRSANVFIWLTNLLVAKIAPHPSQKINTKEVDKKITKGLQPEVMPEGLAKVLARFGNAIADRYGLPPAPTSP